MRFGKSSIQCFESGIFFPCTFCFAFLAANRDGRGSHFSQDWSFQLPKTKKDQFFSSFWSCSDLSLKLGSLYLWCWNYWRVCWWWSPMKLAPRIVYNLSSSLWILWLIFHWSRQDFHENPSSQTEDFLTLKKIFWNFEILFWITDSLRNQFFLESDSLFLVLDHYFSHFFTFQSSFH